MPRKGFRFIHTSNLFLDRQLQDVGRLPDGTRALVEDATLTAFQRVVSAAVEHNADFILLAGNSFIETDQSLRARITLIRGFRELAERGIQVFVAPGPADPATAWRDIPGMPDNVTIFFNSDGESVAMMREGNVIASIASLKVDRANAAGDAESDEQSDADCGSETDRPFAIGLAVPSPSSNNTILSEKENAHRLATSHAIDYLALGGSDTRATVSFNNTTAHVPGTPQGCHLASTGSLGCTLAEVTPERAVTCTSIPTAVVRWELLTLDLDTLENAAQESLAAAMRTVLARCQPASGECLWLIHWKITGSGPLADALTHAEFQQSLIAQIERESELPSELQRTHRFLPVRTDYRSRVEEPTDPLARDYFEKLDATLPLTREALERLGEDAELPDGIWTRQLKIRLDRMDTKSIVSHARHCGDAWLDKVGEGTIP